MQLSCIGIYATFDTEKKDKMSRLICKTIPFPLNFNSLLVSNDAKILTRSPSL